MISGRSKFKPDNNIQSREDGVLSQATFRNDKKKSISERRYTSNATTTNFFTSCADLHASGDEPKLKCGFDIDELHRAEEVAEKQRTLHKNGTTYGQKIFHINQRSKVTYYGPKNEKIKNSNHQQIIAPTVDQTACRQKAT